jgi:CheY-like chemotaxis protein
MGTARVLIVDDNQQTCQLLSRLLTTGGFAVFVVTSGETPIVERAIAAAWQCRPHVIIIDLRLQTDDYNGLDLLHKVNSAHRILYSAHLTPSIIREVNHLLYDFIEKSDAPQVLRNGVLRAAAEKSAAVSTVQIAWHSATDQATLTRTMTEPTLPPPPVDLLDDLVVQLYGATRQVRLEPLQRTQSAPSGAMRTQSAVFLAQSDDLQPTVLKLARRNQIEREAENYQRYVQQRRHSRFATQLLQTTKFWDCGGVVYSFMGTGNETLPTFTTFYHQQPSAESILRPLQFFFGEVWRANYSSRQPLPESTLLEAYEPVFKLLEHERTINDFFDQMVWPVGLARPYIKPLTWAIHHSNRLEMKDVTQAVTHGDLHGDNLFVDEERAWVIDFERTGPGHALRDFAELEVDIVTRLVPQEGIDDDAFLAFLGALYPFPSNGLELTDQTMADAQPDLQKAYEVIQGLRRLAHDLVAYGDEEYLWSVLLDALFVVSIQAAQPWQRRRALLVSTVICNVLR